MSARKILLIPILALLLARRSSGDSRLKIDSDGGYQGLVIKIDKDVPEEKCPALLANIEVSKIDTLGNSNDNNKSRPLKNLLSLQ